MTAELTPPEAGRGSRAGLRARPEFFRRFLRLAGPYWWSERKRAARWVTLAVVVEWGVSPFSPPLLFQSTPGPKTG